MRAFPLDQLERTSYLQKTDKLNIDNLSVFSWKSMTGWLAVGLYNQDYSPPKQQR